MHAPRQELHIGRRKQFRFDPEAIKKIETPHDFSSQLNMRDLIFADRNEVRVVENDVG